MLSNRQAVDWLVFNLDKGAPSASDELGREGLCDLTMVELVNHSLLVLVLNSNLSVESRQVLLDDVCISLRSVDHHLWSDVRNRKIEGRDCTCRLTGRLKR